MERLTVHNISDFTKTELKPCNTCLQDPVDCGNQKGIDIPNANTSVMCVKYGPVEILDLRSEDKVTRLRLKRNGEPYANSGVLATQEVAL